MKKDEHPLEKRVKELLTEEEYKIYLEHKERSKEIFSKTERDKRKGSQRLQKFLDPNV